jgi:hypothetical protein
LAPYDLLLFAEFVGKQELGIVQFVFVKKMRKEVEF